jgi:hypothetical protein
MPLGGSLALPAPRFGPNEKPALSGTPRERGDRWHTHTAETAVARRFFDLATRNKKRPVDLVHGAF